MVKRSDFFHFFSPFFAFFEQTNNVRVEFLPPTQSSETPASPQLPPLIAQSSQRSYEAREKKSNGKSIISNTRALGGQLLTVN